MVFTIEDAKSMGKFHECHWNWNTYNLALEGDPPRDGAWVYWVDSYGNIELARMVIGVIDRFSPDVSRLQFGGKSIIGWFENLKSENNGVRKDPNGRE